MTTGLDQAKAALPVARAGSWVGASVVAFLLYTSWLPRAWPLAAKLATMFILGSAAQLTLQWTFVALLALAAAAHDTRKR